MIVKTEKYDTFQEEVEVVRGRLELTTGTTEEIEHLRSLWFRDTSTWKTPTIVEIGSNKLLVKSENIGTNTLRLITKGEIQDGDEVFVKVEDGKVVIDVFDIAFIWKV